MTSTKTAPAREPAAGSDSRPTPPDFLAEDQFVTRHNGPRPADVQAMLGVHHGFVGGFHRGLRRGQTSLTVAQACFARSAALAKACRIDLMRSPARYFRAVVV